MCTPCTPTCALYTPPPASLTGLPWSGPLFWMELDSVTRLAIALVANVLNLALGLMLARGSD